jgi:hypothetical protein
VKLFTEEMKAARGNDIAEHAIRPVKVIPASLLPVCYDALLICILGLQWELLKMKERRMRTQVGKKLIVVIM